MRPQINSRTLLLSTLLLLSAYFVAPKVQADAGSINNPSQGNKDIDTVDTNPSTNTDMDRAWKLWQDRLSNIIIRRLDSQAFNAFKKSKMPRFHCRMSVVFTVTDGKQIKNVIVTSRSINKNEQATETHAQAWIKEILATMQEEKMPLLQFPDTTVKDKKVVLFINRDFRQLLVQ